MENCFIVTEQSELHKDYYDYRENVKIVDNIVKGLMDKYNINTKYYYVDKFGFAIEPTEKDVELFDKMLKVPIENGIRFFKKYSKIHKEWMDILKTKNIKVLRKPFVGFYFNGVHGKFKTRLFDIDDVLYCSIECGSVDDIECPEGMKRIKTSEFYKIVEDNSEDKSDTDK